MRHAVTINVSDEHGQSTRVLKGESRWLPKKLLNMLFGEYTHVYLLSPGETVESVNIREKESNNERENS